MIKLAVAGAGYWGKNLLRNFDQLDVLAGIFDTEPENPQFGLYPNAKAYSSYDDLLADESIDAIAIATPAHLHYGMTKQALEHGKHVFVEKPLCLSIKEGEELVELSKTTGNILMVGHLLQYHPVVERIKSLLEEGVLGKIEYIYSNRLNFGKLRTEEDVLWSFAPHDISVILSLVNASPKRVSANAFATISKNIADTSIVHLSFDNDVKAHIFVSWLNPFKEQKLVVVGSEGMIVFDDTASQEEKLALYKHTVDWQSGTIPVANKTEAEFVVYEQCEPLNQECRHFLTCIKNNQTPRTSAQEGVNVLAVLNASAQSQANHGEWVALNGDGTAGFFAHETAHIDEPSEIGNNTKIWHFSHILKGSKVGEKCNIGQNVVIGPNAVVGNNVKIQNNVSVYEGVELEDNVFCGPSMVFTNVFNPRSEVPRMHELRKTKVEKGATIGANATIVCGNTLGAYCLIGAGAVVTKPVPKYAMMLGNPARLTGWMCRCGTKLQNVESEQVAKCSDCGNQYTLEHDKLVAVKEHQAD